MSRTKIHLTRSYSTDYICCARATSVARTLSLSGIAMLLAAFCFASVSAQTRQRPRPAQATTTTSTPQSSDALLIRILAAEDTRQWNADVALLLQSRAASVRTRAALAAGRIGDERAVAPLVRLLRTDADEGVRAMAAFALGEIESVTAADALLEVLQNARALPLRTRAVEALGKIAAALPDGNEIRRAAIGDAILRTLDALQKKTASATTTVVAAAPQRVSQPLRAAGRRQ